MPGPRAETKARAKISLGNARKNICDAHEHRVDDPAEIPCNRAHKDSHRGSNDGHKADDVKGQSRAENNPGKNITPHLVGTQISG